MHRLATKGANIYNACKAIVPLIKPFVLRRFRCRCGLLRSLLLCSIKKSRCRLIVFYLLPDLALEKFHSGAVNRKILFHSKRKLRKIFENSLRNVLSNGKFTFGWIPLLQAY